MSDELVQGWKAIVDVVAEARAPLPPLSMTRCVELAKREADAMPLYRSFGLVYAKRDELVEWVRGHVGERYNG